MLYKRRIIIGLALVYSLIIQAQTSLTISDLHVPTGIAPAYFGPNAFPVPNMVDGCVDTCLRIDVQGDYAIGYKQDKTETLAFRVAVPLFCDRASFVIWGQAYEWWQRADACGHGAGDIYISTDIQVLRERHFMPNVTLRAAVKTASGGDFTRARYYDAPGYFFDATIGKTMAFRRCSLRLAASAGFLCWQTDNGRQNDAVMYGVMVKFLSKHIELSELFAGYSGWENHASGRTDAGDCPMILQTKMRYLVTENWSLAAQYEWGIHDYPYHVMSFTVGYSFPILALKNKRGAKGCQ